MIDEKQNKTKTTEIQANHGTFSIITQVIENFGPVELLTKNGSLNEYQSFSFGETT